MNRFVKILLHIIGTIVCVFVAASIDGLFDCTTKAEFLVVVSDACFITGGLFCGVGMISFAVKAGAFDSIGKAALNAEEGQSLEEYNKKKQGKRKWFRILTSCGVACIVIAFALSLV